MNIQHKSRGISARSFPRTKTRHLQPFKQFLSKISIPRDTISVNSFTNARRQFCYSRKCNPACALASVYIFSRHKRDRSDSTGSQSVPLENFIIYQRHCSIYIILMDRVGGELKHLGAIQQAQRPRTS